MNVMLCYLSQLIGKSIGCRWQGFGASVRRGRGLPYDRHKRFQTASTDPPQSRAELLRQAGAASEKMYLRKRKVLPGTQN